MFLCWDQNLSDRFDPEDGGRLSACWHAAYSPIPGENGLKAVFFVLQVMVQILKDMGISEYEPRVINQMLEFTYSQSCSPASTTPPLRCSSPGSRRLFLSYVCRVCDHHHRRCKNLRHARQEVHRGCRRHQAGDPVPHGPVVHLAAPPWREPPPPPTRECSVLEWQERSSAPGSSLQFLLEVARQKNQTPLPLIKPYTGPRLPPDRYCLTAPNYRLKSTQKKVKVSAFIWEISLFVRCCDDFLPLSLAGVISRQQDFGSSPQRWCRFQQAEHADPRWGT